MNQEALKELLIKIADDQLILGHRNSEWTGLGPLLEEDIAFSSMAQDKVGQSYAFYQLLNQLGEVDPDSMAFQRNAENFRNCQMVELPNQEYDFSLIRHFLFDKADYLRFELLSLAAYQPLADLAKKLIGEVRYHVMHADAFIKQLGTANEESILRLQSSLNKCFPFALGIFEKSEFESELIDEKIFAGEAELRERWLHSVFMTIEKTELTMPDVEDVKPVLGGRKGIHTEHLQPLLIEMAEVINIDPNAEW
jgi:ring-1,2-phenylacetyl-CoA epoxidase subunit PaaC